MPGRNILNLSHIPNTRNTEMKDAQEYRGEELSTQGKALLLLTQEETFKMQLVAEPGAETWLVVLVGDW